MIVHGYSKGLRWPPYVVGSVSRNYKHSANCLPPTFVQITCFFKTSLTIRSNAKRHPQTCGTMVFVRGGKEVYLTRWNGKIQMNNNVSCECDKARQLLMQPVSQPLVTWGCWSDQNWLSKTCDSLVLVQLELVNSFYQTIHSPSSAHVCMSHTHHDRLYSNTGSSLKGYLIEAYSVTRLLCWIFPCLTSPPSLASFLQWIHTGFCDCYQQTRSWQTLWGNIPLHLKGS